MSEARPDSRGNVLRNVRDLILSTDGRRPEGRRWHLRWSPIYCIGFSADNIPPKPIAAT